MNIAEFPVISGRLSTTVTPLVTDHEQLPDVEFVKKFPTFLKLGSSLPSS
jgi:hypothetical protein